MSRNIFITGASSGIGKAIAYSFGKNGDDIILCARRKDKLIEIKADIERRYGVNVYINRRKFAIITVVQWLHGIITN